MMILNIFFMLHDSLDYAPVHATRHLLYSSGGVLIIVVIHSLPIMDIGKFIEFLYVDEDEEALAAVVWFQAAASAVLLGQVATEGQRRGESSLGGRP